VNLTDSDLRQQFRKAHFLPAGMRTIALPWGDVAGHHRRAARKELPYTLDHADRREQQIDQHPPDQATVTLSLTEDVSSGRTTGRGGSWASRCHQIEPR
jgi:hypothetical protein